MSRRHRPARRPRAPMARAASCVNSRRLQLRPSSSERHTAAPAPHAVRPPDTCAERDPSRSSTSQHHLAVEFDPDSAPFLVNSSSFRTTTCHKQCSASHVARSGDDQRHDSAARLDSAQTEDRFRHCGVIVIIFGSATLRRSNRITQAADNLRRVSRFRTVMIPAGPVNSFPVPSSTARTISTTTKTVSTTIHHGAEQEHRTHQHRSPAAPEAGSRGRRDSAGSSPPSRENLHLKNIAPIRNVKRDSS